MEVQIENILKQGCWKKYKKTKAKQNKQKTNKKTFNLYYDKVITVYDPDDIDFNRTC